MGNDKSKATNYSDFAANAKQAFAHLIGTVPHGPINTQMVQNVLLIWLDKNIDVNNADCQNTVTQLRSAVNTINTFTDGDQCIRFFKSMTNEKTCIIISGAFGQHIVP